MAIKVLLCDQETILRSGLRALLERESDIEVVGEAGDGLEAVAMARRLRPTVVIMDIPMPKLDGIQATWQLTGPGIAEPAGVVILTAADDDETVIEALRAGARAFLLKGDPAGDLIAAIRVVADGGAVIAPLVARRLLDQFAGSFRRPRLRPPSSPMPTTS
jgi:DNA-binding NarL/FixJ family response regulator